MRLHRPHRAPGLRHHRPLTLLSRGRGCRIPRFSGGFGTSWPLQPPRSARTGRVVVPLGLEGQRHPAGLGLVRGRHRPRAGVRRHPRPWPSLLSRGRGCQNGPGRGASGAEGTAPDRSRGVRPRQLACGYGGAPHSAARTTAPPGRRPALYGGARRTAARTTAPPGRRPALRRRPPPPSPTAAATRPPPGGHPALRRRHPAATRPYDGAPPGRRREPYDGAARPPLGRKPAPRPLSAGRRGGR
jgi:hypothetical protein